MPVKILPGQTTGVRLTPYFVQNTEVTKGLYYYVMKDNPNGLIVTQPTDLEKNEPIECSFAEAVTFCNRMSKMLGLEPVYAMRSPNQTLPGLTTTVNVAQKDPDVWDFLWSTGARDIIVDLTANGFRLPNDAEYQFAMGSGYDAVMSGSTVDHYVWKDSNNVSHNISDIGWTSETGVLAPQNVAQKIPNEYGLYDLSGNVSEWINDSEAVITSNSTYKTKFADYSDGSINFMFTDILSSTQSYMTKYTQNYTTSSGSLPKLYNLNSQHLKSTYALDEGGDYTKNESYAVPYSDTKYPENLTTREGINNSRNLTDNGDGTWSSTVLKGFRIVKQQEPTIINKYDDNYKFLLLGSAIYPMRKVVSSFYNQGAQSTDITMPNYDTNAQSDEGPVHKVLLTSDFYIGVTGIGYNLWQAVMTMNKNYIHNVLSGPTYMGSNYNTYNVGYAYNDANFSLRTMTNSTKLGISWRKVLVFCNRLSRMLGLEPVYHLDGEYNEENWFSTKTGTYAYCDFINGQNQSASVNLVKVDKSKNGFRLPSESEFEYVIKGGVLKDTFKYAGTNDKTLIGFKSSPYIGQYYNYLPNGLGVYDLMVCEPEYLQDSMISNTSLTNYSNTTYYPQPRTGEDFIINPIVEANSSWSASYQRSFMARGIDAPSASNNSSNNIYGRNTWRGCGAGNSWSNKGYYKYTNNYDSMNMFRLVLQYPEVLPENMSSYKISKERGVVLDYKQVPNNRIHSSYNSYRDFDYHNYTNYQLQPNKTSFNLRHVPLGYGPTSFRQKTLKRVEESDFLNYNNSSNSATVSYSKMTFYASSSYNFYVDVAEVPLTIETYRAIYPNCPELEYYNNYYANSHNDPGSYRQYYGINWYKAIEICNRLSIAFGYVPVYKINNTTNPDNWPSIPTDEMSAIADYTNYSGTGGCWNEPALMRATSTAATDFYTCGIKNLGFRLPTCLEMLYIAFGGDDTYNDTQLYPGSNEISDVSCFKIVNNSGTQISNYAQVTNLSDYHLESKNGLTYAEGYSKNKMYKSNCFELYDLATNCCLCYDYLETTDSPGTNGKYIAPLKLSNTTTGYRKCCAFGVPSGVDHTTDTNTLAHYSMRKFTDVKPWESYPWQSLRIVRTLYYNYVTA